VPDVLAGGGIDGSGAVPRGEMSLVGEAGDVTDLDEQSGCAGWTDAMQLSECAAGRGEQFAEFFVGGLLAPLGSLQVTDQLGGHALARLAGGIARPDSRQ
jgi:hypothetical protein